jgi:predicted GIY-YIG superfamily endonuclease
MNPKFARIVDLLEPKFQRLVTMAAVRPNALPRVMPNRGIYLFSDQDQHLYVGRSNNIRRRIGLHCRPGSQQNQATFAFRMARQQTGITAAAYTSEGSRARMVENEVFGAAFTDCKTQIRALDVRFVEEQDGTNQALLEIYVATVLETPFNDFENH